MRKVRTALISGALLIAILLVVSCGDSEDGDVNGSAGGDIAGVSPATGEDGDEETPNPDAAAENGSSEAALSKAVFLKRGNAICEVVVKKITSEAFPALEKANRESADAREAAETELVRTVMVPGLREEAEAIEALGVPAQGKEAEAVLAAIYDVVEKGEVAPESFTQSAERPYAEAEQLAEKYGLTECPYG